MMSTPPLRFTLICIALLLLGGSLYAQEDLAVAQSYYNSEEYDKALVYIEEAEKMGVSKPLFELKLNCYLALTDYKEAADWIEDNLKANRFNPVDLYIDLIKVQLAAGEVKKADKAYVQLQEVVRQNPNYAYSAGNNLQRAGFPQMALDIYLLAESLRSNLNFDYQKAQLYGELGNIEKMYEMYVDLLSLSPNYLNNIQQLLGRSYQSGGALVKGDYLKQLLINRIQEGGPQTLNQLLVYLFVQEEAYSQAFVQLRALDKRGLLAPGELYKLGKIAFENTDYFTAQRILDYVLAKGDNDPFYESALSLNLQVKTAALEEKDTTPEAWTELLREYAEAREILKGAPLAGQVAIAEAHLLAFKLNKPAEAKSLLKQTINTITTSEEDMALAKIELADILLYTGQRWDAILYYGQAEKAFEFSPIGQEAKFKRAKAAYYVGDFEWAQGIFGVLKESTSKLIANDAMQYSLLIADNIAMDTNTEAMATYAKADLLQYQNKIDSSLRILGIMEIAFMDHPVQDDVLLLKARLLERKGLPAEAANYYQQVVENYGSGILADDALYALAQLYEGPLADPEKAKGYYEQIFTKYADSFFASDARKRFREMRGDILN
jgi:tetratricopeptide (TPR) repeat protein